MTMLERKLIERSFIRQHDMTDCGAACLLSLVKYYGGESSILHLREISGTTNTGTTLLGLYQAARKMGFDARGAEANGIADLIKHGKPCILSVVTRKSLYHYVVCYGYDNDLFTICDPAKGVVDLTKHELDTIWTRKCLLLEPNSSFERKEDIASRKKSWLFRLVRDDLGLLGSSVAIGLVLAILGMVMAVFSQKLIDDVLPARNITKLIAGITMVLSLLLAKVVLTALRGKLLITQSRNLNNRMIHFFFDKLLNLPKSFFDMRKTGDMVARLNDTRRIQSVIGTLAGDSIINALVVLVSVIFLFLYSWEVAIIAVISMPIFYWIISKNNSRIIARQQDVMSSYALSESGFINTINGIADIKSFSRQPAFLKLNESLYSFFQSKVFRLGGTQLELGIWTGISGIIMQVSIIAICSAFVINGSLSTGSLMAIIGITGTLFPSIAGLALVMIAINEAKVAFDRMYEIVDAQEENMTSDKIVNLNVEYIETRNLAFRFVGRKRIFEDITLRFKKGSVTCIVGESGCGKSTLCQVLERFYEPEEGEILLDGKPAADIPLGQWRDIMSVVPQEIFIHNGTVLENICFGNIPESVDEVAIFCQKFGFDKFIAEMPNGLGTLVGEEGINLSGGQKQIIAFARALYKPCKVLILDEMTAAMDRKAEKRICDLLGQLKKDHIIIFVTHRLETVRTIADNIVVMESGRVMAQGSHSELMESDNFYSGYWKSLRS